MTQVLDENLFPTVKARRRARTRASEAVMTEKMNFKNGTVLVSYRNGFTALRFTPKGGNGATVEQFIDQLEERLLYDEHIEIDGFVINVYKTYNVPKNAFEPSVEKPNPGYTELKLKALAEEKYVEYDLDDFTPFKHSTSE